LVAEDLQVDRDAMKDWDTRDVQIIVWTGLTRTAGCSVSLRFLPSGATWASW
jgi:hypothetical protein